MGCCGSKEEDEFERRPLLNQRIPSHQPIVSSIPDSPQRSPLDGSDPWHDGNVGKLEESPNEKRLAAIVVNATENLIDVSQIRTIDRLKPVDAQQRELDYRQKISSLKEKLAQNDPSVASLNGKIQDVLSKLDEISVESPIPDKFIVPEVEEITVSLST